jgi:protein ImuA
MPSLDHSNQTIKFANSPFKIGMIRAGLHEIYAATEADGAAATGFALATIGQLMVQKRIAGNNIVILWAYQDLLQSEAGGIYPPGLIEFGIAPASVAMVHTRNGLDTLQAGLEAARCGKLVAVLVEFWGAARAYDLTASRKLSLAAKTSGVSLFLLRHAAPLLPSAAETRWRVQASPSRPLAANAPGRSAFDVTLLRHRGGKDGQHWQVEWNRDTACFEESSLATITGHVPPPAPLPGDLVAFSPHRPAAPANDDGFFRKTG